MRLVIENENVQFSFVAMEYYWLMLNRTFKIFLTSEYLVGVKVQGIIAASPKYAINPEWQNQDKFVPEGISEKYGNESLTINEILEANRNNFALKISDVCSVSFDKSKKWGMGSVPHTGKIYVSTSNGRTREFILLGKQDGENVCRELS